MDSDLVLTEEELPENIRRYISRSGLKLDQNVVRSIRVAADKIGNY